LSRPHWREILAKTARTADWLEARAIADAYERANSWTGERKTQPVASEPASITHFGRRHSWDAPAQETHDLSGGQDEECCRAGETVASL